MSTHKSRTRKFVKDRMKAEAKPNWDVAELLNRLQRATDMNSKAYDKLEAAVIAVHAPFRQMVDLRARAMFSHDPELEEQAAKATSEYADRVADHLNCLAEQRAKRVAHETLKAALKIAQGRFTPELLKPPTPAVQAVAENGGKIE